MRINEVIVVEGNNDATRLKQIFDVETITTNGSQISLETLELIKKVSLTKGVIIFCDPDYPGEKIRATIMKHVPCAKHAYINKLKAIDYQKNKVGVEHACTSDLIESLENVVTYQDTSSLDWQEYLMLDLVGCKASRQLVCDKLNISYANAKTLYKRLNMLNLTYEEILQIKEI